MSGAYAQAIPVVSEAARLILPGAEQRLAYAAHVIFAACLYETGRLQEADSQLAPARALAIELESSLDLARCDWLGARLSAKRGLRTEALAGFTRAREAFAAHNLALDCAAVALHESIVLLEAGEISRVKRTAGSIAWTFAGQGIEREGREAVELFCRAAEREEATIALARWAFARLSPAPPHGVAARS
jgi:tetratricopeptide (TPR) repeat protein